MPSRTRYSQHLENDEEHELSRGEGMIVQMARAALGDVIEEYSPTGSNKLALAVTAIAGLFSDTVCRMSNAADICTVVNRQLASAGFELVPLKRN